MAKSFVNQNLCDRSFRGQDLTGADFTGADLRGCDFRDATLVGANFTAVKTGKSTRQLIILIAIPIVCTVVFLFASPFWFVNYNIGAVYIVLALLVSSREIDEEEAFSPVFRAAATSIMVASGISVATLLIIDDGWAYIYIGWLGNNIIPIIRLMTFFIAITGSFYYGIKLIKIIENATGTLFLRANLTSVKFFKADLRLISFRGTNCHLVNWHGAKIYNCELPSDINYLYFQCHTYPIRMRNSDLRNLYLLELDLSDADLQNVMLKDSDLSGIKLNKANLQNAILNNTNFSNANLNNANLSNVQALGTNFTGANLTGACIENWWINPNTKFDDVICDYIFLNQKLTDNGQIVYDSNSRKPAIGSFQQGDFTKLIRQYLDSLDLIFRNGDDPKIFAFALQELLNNYSEAEIEFKSLDNLGDGDIALRLIVGNQSIHKSKLHSFFVQASNLAKSFFVKSDSSDTKQLQSDIKQLKEKLESKDRHIEILESQLTSKKQTSSLDGKVGNNFSLISVIVQDSMFGNKKTNINAGGDVSGVAGGNISGVAGKDQKGIAGRDINGQVTVTIQQLRDNDAPEAPQLVELLTQLQTTIAESPDLSDKDKQKALKYLDNIGEIANKKDGDRNRIDELIDNILGVASKAAKLLTPVQAIADNLRKLLQL